MYKRQFIVQASDHQLRIDDFAYQHGINKTFLKDIKTNGDILVDGVHKTVRYVLSIGETITFVFPEEINRIPKEDIPLHIIYEDKYLLIINKPKGMPCFPTHAHPCHTLANALSFYYQSIKLSSTIHFVNRLDKDTAGLMIVAKYRIIHDMMGKNMKHIYRKYHAHVHGFIREQGCIDLPIYRKGNQMKRTISKLGKRSITDYRRLNYDQNISFVECLLETGRTHQIRVHMSAIKHPLIGDSLYGYGKGEFDLESIMIAFVHPVSQQIKIIKRIYKNPLDQSIL